MKNIAGVILAAGEGTRMKSDIPKVLHKLCGKPMLNYMIEAFSQLGIKRSIVVVGHKQELIKEALKGVDGIKTLRQPKLLGSADALRRAKNAFSHFNADLLVVYGDTPLIRYQSLKKLVQSHQKSGAGCTILTAVLKNPSGFGRIIRGEDNRIARIVEEQDADIYEKAIGEVNVGAYCFRARELFAALEEIKPENAKKEYYLTDVVELLNRKKLRVESVSTQDEEEAQGINSRRDLIVAHAIINKRNIENLISSGVTIVDPVTTYIYGEIEIGRDTVIYPHTIIEGKVVIGRRCQIGPFVHLSSGIVLKDGARISNFMQVASKRKRANF